MQRKARVKQLEIWLNGEHAATWTPEGRQATTLLYDENWLKSKRGRPLSLSLPFPLLGNEPLRGAAVQHYFDNLLPDSDAIRRRLAERYTGGSESAFDLLSALGRDCVGAIQLLAADTEPLGFNKIEAEPISDEQIAALLRSTTATGGLGIGHQADEFRISIAGAQEKTALLWHEGQWQLPRGSTPTTHIFKMPLGLVGNMQADMNTSVQNEWLCLQLLSAFGLDVPSATISKFSDHAAVLVVERFDRRMHPSKKWIMRLPQEDFCQVLAISPAKKYEADGGPSIESIARVLSGSVHVHKDLATLLKSQILFWMMAATDGHGKNFSIRLLADGAFMLTPLYDVLSAWPIIGDKKNQLSWPRTKLAMAVSGKNRHYHLAQIQRRHFNATALRCGWGADAEDLIEELLEKVDASIERAAATLPPDFPTEMADAIFKGVKSQAERLAQQPPN